MYACRVKVISNFDNKVKDEVPKELEDYEKSKSVWLEWKNLDDATKQQIQKEHDTWVEADLEWQKKQEAHALAVQADPSITPTHGPRPDEPRRVPEDPGNFLASPPPCRPS